MDPDAIPVAQKPRHVPYHLQQPLKEWLPLGVEENIFEKFSEGVSITWRLPLVMQPKSKNTEVDKLVYLKGRKCCL